MKKILTLILLLTSIILPAKDIRTSYLQEFSINFKKKLDENSYTGLFCYVTQRDRRIFACDNFHKKIYLANSSNIFTNYLASLLEKEGKFDRNANVQDYAKIFKFNASKISFSDLISSTASISRHLDKIYPKDASEYEYFDFLWQLNPNLLSDSKYDFSKISNLGAIYALSYSQSKKSTGLMSTYESLVATRLKPNFPSLELSKSDNNLDLSFSLNIRDFTEYLARDLRNFASKNKAEKGKFSNAWLFTEMGTTRLAMVAGQGKDTFLIANFYDRDIAVAIYIDNAKDEKARNFASFVLQDFVELLNR